jgi:3-oxoacyl-[acyl-carrier-protein] synthase-1
LKAENKKRIFLSRPGLVSAAGNSAEELWRVCCSGIVPNANPEKYVEVLPTFPQSEKFPQSKIFRLMFAALEQIRPAVEKASAKYGRERIGLLLGSCDNGAEASLEAHKIFLAEGAFPQNYTLKEQSASYPAEVAAEFLGIAGPIYACATACASGASAIARGAELIRAVVCDAVVAGGADIVSPTVVQGFAALEALSAEQTNPFSKNRRGINLGEGAAFLLLSADKDDVVDAAAENSGSGAVAELLGYGESADARHITSPDPAGEGAAAARKAALADAGLSPADIAYVNLHGTGTDQNDSAESFAMKAVFGESQPPCSSTKPITGHTLGAAGAIEAAVVQMFLTKAQRTQRFPVHVWDGVRDENLPALNFVENLSNSQLSTNNSQLTTRNSQLPSAMSNSFAFGGCNISLILGKANDD